jgi:hypothetical protein
MAARSPLAARRAPRESAQQAAVYCDIQISVRQILKTADFNNR